jgi:hypothetical protein
MATVGASRVLSYLISILISEPLEVQMQTLTSTSEIDLRCEVELRALTTTVEL